MAGFPPKLLSCLQHHGRLNFIAVLASCSPSWDNPLPLKTLSDHHPVYLLTTVTLIQILGINGSEATNQLSCKVRQAVEELGIPAIVEQVSDVDSFMQFDINGIPALAMDGAVVLQKNIPEVEDLKILINTFSKSQRNKSVG